MCTPSPIHSQPVSLRWFRRTRASGTVKVTFFFFWVLVGGVLSLGEALGADLSVLNGNINLTISSAVAGQEPGSVADEACQLQWSTGSNVWKITAQTSMNSPKFTLTTRAISVSAGDGTAVGEIALTVFPADLVVDIPAEIPVGDPGTCTLLYAASATAADGTGTDVHTVTYTIVNQ